MKTLIALLLATVATYAQTPELPGATSVQLNCVVPVEGSAPAIKVVIDASEESQGDFFVVTISEPGKELVYFNQLEKGSVRAGLAQGQLVALVVSEGVAVENGAVRGAGFVVIAKSAEGMGGFLSLNNSFYPLSCQ